MKSSRSHRRWTDLRHTSPWQLMKRIILEWGMIFSVGMALATATLWVFTTFFDQTSYHHSLSTSRSAGDDLHVLVGDGDLTLCDQFKKGASGKVRPLIVDSRTIGRHGHITIPGFDLRYYQNAPNGYTVWSLSLSLLISVALLFLLAILFGRRLSRLRKLPQKQVSTRSRPCLPVRTRAA